MVLIFKFYAMFMITVQGSGSASQGEVSFLSWNSKVQHILASTSYNGTTGEEGCKLNLYIYCSHCCIVHTNDRFFMRFLFWFYSPVVWDLKKQKSVIR
jgi:hypothetical protein